MDSLSFVWPLPLSSSSHVMINFGSIISRDSLIFSLSLHFLSFPHLSLPPSLSLCEFQRRDYMFWILINVRASNEHSSLLHQENLESNANFNANPCATFLHQRRLVVLHVPTQEMVLTLYTLPHNPWLFHLLLYILSQHPWWFLHPVTIHTYNIMIFHAVHTVFETCYHPHPRTQVRVITTCQHPCQWITLQLNPWLFLTHPSSHHLPPCATILTSKTMMFLEVLCLLERTGHPLHPQTPRVKDRWQ